MVPKLKNRTTKGFEVYHLFQKGGTEVVQRWYEDRNSVKLKRTPTTRNQRNQNQKTTVKGKEMKTATTTEQAYNYYFQIMGAAPHRPFRGEELSYTAPRCPDCGERKDGFIINSARERERYGSSFWCRPCAKSWTLSYFLKEVGGFSAQEIYEVTGEDYRRRSKAPRVPKPPPEPSIKIENQYMNLEAFQNLTRALIRKQNESVEGGLHRVNAYHQKLLRNRGIEFPFDGDGYSLHSVNTPFGLKAGDSVYTIPPGLMILNFREESKGDELSPFSVKIRKNNSGSGRYWKLPITSNNPAIFSFNPESPLIILESELDGILLSRLVGDRFTIMTVGGSSPVLDSQSCDVIRQASRVWLMWDTDPEDANKIKFAKLSQAFRSAFPGVGFTEFRLPVKDPGEFVETYSAELLKQFLIRELG